MVKPEHRFAEGLTTVLEVLSMVCIVAMALLVIAQVVLRYVFNDPLDWSEAMARITFIYITFIGIGAAYGRRRHMAIDALIIALPAKLRRIVEVSTVGLATAFLIALIGLTIRSMVGLNKMEVTTPALEYPMAFVYLIMPLGLSALIVQMWLDLYKERSPS